MSQFFEIYSNFEPSMTIIQRIQIGKIISLIGCFGECKILILP